MIDYLFFQPSVQQESDDTFALINACKNGCPEVVEELIHKGVDIDHLDEVSKINYNRVSGN